MWRCGILHHNMFVCIFHNKCLCPLSLHITIYVVTLMSVCICVGYVGLCLSSCPHFFLLFFGPVCVLSFSIPLPCFQVRTLASAGGPDNLVMLDPGKYKSRPRVPEPAGDGSSTQPKWQIGEQEFEALMRMLDNLVGTKKMRKRLQSSGCL